MGGDGGVRYVFRGVSDFAHACDITNQKRYSAFDGSLMNAHLWTLFGLTRAYSECRLNLLSRTKPERSRERWRGDHVNAEKKFAAFPQKSDSPISGKSLSISCFLLDNFYK
jgi:hypothetical protein